MAEPHRDVGMKCIKYMLLMVTSIFLLVSALIISIGATILAIYKDVSYFLELNFSSPASLLVAIGVIMLFVSFFGCIGALKESTCLVNMFGVMLSIVFVLEISAAIAAYSYRGQVPNMLEEKLVVTIPQYYQEKEVTDAFDFIQSRLYCCGVEGYDDWSMVDPSYNVGIKVNDTLTVPNSCCAKVENDDTGTPTCTAIFSNGCLPSIIYLVYQSAGLLGVGATTIAFVQAIGIMFAFSLASSIRKAKSERERRKWEIREKMLNAHSKLTTSSEKKAPVVYVPFHGQTFA